MNLALILGLLQGADTQVADGDRAIAAQHDLISRSERSGQAATSAIARLRQMEQTQVQRIAVRDGMRAELATLSGRTRR